jgi:hypothetical protein
MYAAGEAGEDVEPRRAERVVVEPEQRGRHLRRLVRVQHGLRLADPEPERGDCGAAIAVGSYEAAVQVRHDADLVGQWRQARVDRQPVGIRRWERVLESQRHRRSASGDDGHAEGAGLTGQPRAVVVGPDRRRWHLRM